MDLFLLNVRKSAFQMKLTYFVVIFLHNWQQPLHPFLYLNHINFFLVVVFVFLLLYVTFLVPFNELYRQR